MNCSSITAFIQTITLPLFFRHKNLSIGPPEVVALRHNMFALYEFHPDHHHHHLRLSNGNVSILTGRQPI